jgi:hypothetical protein
MKVLNSIGSNDGKLLSYDSVDLLFAPQLSGAALKTFRQFPLRNTSPNVNYGFGGKIVLEDLDTGRKKGSLNWSGLPNLFWSIDRETGLNCFYASQILPSGDYRSLEMHRLFETEMYRRFNEAKRGGY